ncbi:Holliday junction resolvase RecU [Geomicrobium sp. JCM 19055]|uniref:Holliday junction resolvase RecU n=1 Tax=Geomicrobium sp. JCM 19055 TaxID=1460649 RepID=UPI002236B5B6|nr:Holliday junction resolvase RecU [Geomicrobium sp. JCM 19055]
MIEFLLDGKDCSQLAFRYPNGKLYEKKVTTSKKTDDGNANRGMTLEDDLNASIHHYLQIGKAVIHKKPTPVQIVSVDYPKRTRAKITEAYFRQASTTDYNGIYKGYHLDFEAKETHQKQSFPLKNIHDHQIEHLNAVTAHGGLAFLILRFAHSKETYVLKAEDFMKLKAETDRKSIKKDDIATLGIFVNPSILPTIDFLPAVEQLFRLNV